MLAKFRPFLLRWLRVPHDPEPPLGAPGSAKIFRAGANYYYVKLAAWLAAQAGAVVGILFSVGFLSNLRSEFDAAQEARAARLSGGSGTAVAPADTPTLPRDMKSKKNRAQAKQAFAERVPPWVMDLITLAELLGIAGFVLQLPITFAAVRLDWELRWYIVTDRSLRIRAGIWKLQEITMSFANLQQVEVHQGPVQRLLGIADVRVQSAGGGSAPSGKGHDLDDSLHTGVFHGVDNAQEIRDLILDRLRHFREAGLGDPDDHASHVPESAAAAPVGDALAAARELLTAARDLRASAERDARA
jgi:membrane protein YdbS with pleckstrin-like domain